MEMLTELRAYLPCSFETLVHHAYELNPSLKTFCDANVLSLRPRDKGNAGKLAEFHLFGRLPNNDSAPDLGPDLGDVKATHIKKTRNGWCAKERLTLANCGSTASYETLQHLLAPMKECRLYPKLRKGIMVVLEHSTEGDVFRETVVALIPYDLETLPDDIQTGINADYAAIQERIRTQTVSQRGQKLLHIHPHGSKGSSTRALGFTNKFLTYLIARGMGAELKTKGRSTYFLRTDGKSPRSSVLVQGLGRSGRLRGGQID